MDNKLLLQDLAQGVSSRISITKKDADQFLRTFFDVIMQYLQEDKIVKIKGLGTFKVVEVSGRDSINVNTGERIHISGHSKISFTPDSSLRDQVNRPFADFETIIINEGIDVAEMERVPYEEAAALEAAALEDSAVEDSAEETLVAEVSVEEPVAPEPKEPAVPEPEEPAVPEPEELVAPELEEPEVPEPEELVAPEPEEPEVPEPEELVAPEPEEPVVPEPEEPAGEKIVYVDNRPCKCCKVCYVLLALALMALSFLAGKQGWFEGLFSCASNGNELKELPVAVPTPEPQDEQTSQTADTSKVANAKADTLSQQDGVAVQPDPSAASQSEKANQPVKEATAAAKSEKPADKPAAATKPSAADTKPSKPADKPTPAVKPAQETTTRKVDSSVKPVIIPPKVQVRDTNSVTSTANPSGAVDTARGTRYEIVGTKCMHTVKSGEGLYRLARIYYGDMKKASYIMKYNNITDPDKITAGSVLKIPDLKAVE